jgi:hypothetical protein
MTNGRSVFSLARILLLILGVATLTGIASAQTASINGTVTDPSGAVVPSATVTVVNEDTNASRDTQTGDTGAYGISNLTPGKYDITIEKSGLKTIKFSAVTLTVDQALTLDAKLEISVTSQTVTVEGTRHARSHYDACDANWAKSGTFQLSGFRWPGQSGTQSLCWPRV